MQKYSVLISLYHKENPEWFCESMDSMLKQTIKPNQIVLVLDGPVGDQLEEKVRFYENSYEHLIDILRLKSNVGLGKALDKGLQICANELVARMDTDDISLPSRCEKQLEKFQQDDELTLIGTNIDEFYDEPSNIVSSRVVPSTHEEIKTFIKRRSPFNHPSVMFKKSVVQDVGGYGKLRRKQDLDLFSRIINSGYKAENINESLLLFRSNKNNFKRRKSWSYVKSYIYAQYTIFKRGDCSIVDFLYVVFGQLTLYVLPLPILKKVSNRFLRATK